MASHALGRTITVLFIIMAVMFIMAMGHEVLVRDILRPNSLFGFILVSVVVSGLLATLIFEKLDLALLS